MEDIDSRMNQGMGKALITAAVLLLTVFVSVGTASATPLGTNITILDYPVSTPPPNGYNGKGIGKEDDETEGNPATYQGQAWDVEGLFLNGNLLQMIGGYKFDTGVTWSDNYNYRSGDIFINLVDTAKPWDYAIRIKGDHTYDVYTVDSTTTLLDPLPQDVPLSTPWRVGANAVKLIPYSGNSYAFGTLTDLESGFSSWQSATDTVNGETDLHFIHNSSSVLNPVVNYDNLHYSVSGIDLGFLGSNKTFDVHFTMECGNDLILGQGTTAVPEPTTLLLLGIGLSGLGIMARRRKSE